MKKLTAEQIRVLSGFCCNGFDYAGQWQRFNEPCIRAKKGTVTALVALGLLEAHEWNGTPTSGRLTADGLVLARNQKLDRF